MTMKSHVGREEDPAQATGDRKEAENQPEFRRTRVRRQEHGCSTAEVQARAPTKKSVWTLLWLLQGDAAEDHLKPRGTHQQRDQKKP